MAREACVSTAISAKAETVWGVLTDFDAYPEWNPVIREVKGPLTTGASLTFRVSRGRGQLVDAAARVMAVQQDRLLAWGGSGYFGLFRGRHSFNITNTATGVIFENREVYQGPLAWLWIKEDFLRMQEASFKAQNGALKQRAEQLETEKQA